MSQFKFQCWTLREFTQDKAGHILNLMDEIINFFEFQVFVNENKL